MKFVQPKAAIEQVEDQLAQIILFREVPESVDMLPSTHLLARRTQACLVTVREAVHRLMAVGLIRIEQGRGLFVDPLSRTRTMDSMLVETRSAELPRQRRKAIARWARTVYFLALESLAQSTRRKPAELHGLSNALEDFDALLAGDPDPLEAADLLCEIFWLAAEASHEDALILGMNSCNRAYPHVRRWLAAGIDAEAMREDWLLVCKLFKARNADGLRQQAARTLQPFFVRVVELSEFEDPEEEAVRRSAQARARLATPEQQPTQPPAEPYAAEPVHAPQGTPPPGAPSSSPQERPPQATGSGAPAQGPTAADLVRAASANREQGPAGTPTAADSQAESAAEAAAEREPSSTRGAEAPAKRGGPDG